MRLFKIVYHVFVRLLFPMWLQKEKMLAWLNVIITPIVRMSAKFDKQRDDNLYYLKHTPQVVHIEAVLNDRWDEGIRRIRIVDGAFNDPTYLYQEIEDKHVYLYQEVEDSPVYLYQEGELYGQGAEFIIEVPYFIQFDQNEMKQLVNKYSLTENFTINIV